MSDLELEVFQSNTSSQADLELMPVHQMCAMEFKDTKYVTVHCSSAVWRQWGREMFQISKEIVFKAGAEN